MPKEAFVTKIIKGGKGKAFELGTKKTGPGGDMLQTGVHASGPAGEAMSTKVIKGGKGPVLSTKIMKGGKGKVMGIGIQTKKEPENVKSLNRLLRGKESKAGRNWDRVKATHRKQK